MSDYRGPALAKARAALAAQRAPAVDAPPSVAVGLDGSAWAPPIVDLGFRLPIATEKLAAVAVALSERERQAERDERQAANEVVAQLAGTPVKQARLARDRALSASTLSSVFGMSVDSSSITSSSETSTIHPLPPTTSDSAAPNFLCSKLELLHFLVRFPCPHCFRQGWDAASNESHGALKFTLSCTGCSRVQEFSASSMFTLSKSAQDSGEPPRARPDGKRYHTKAFQFCHAGIAVGLNNARINKLATLLGVSCYSFPVVDKIRSDMQQLHLATLQAASAQNCLARSFIGDGLVILVDARYAQRGFQAYHSTMSGLDGLGDGTCRLLLMAHALRPRAQSPGEK